MIPHKPNSMSSKAPPLIPEPETPQDETADEQGDQ
jgi:hypothetical protein